MLLGDRERRPELGSRPLELTFIHCEKPENMERARLIRLVTDPLANRLALLEEGSRVGVTPLCDGDKTEQVDRVAHTLLVAHRGVQSTLLLGQPASRLEGRHTSLEFLDSRNLFLFSAAQAFHLSFEALSLLGLLFRLGFGKLASLCSFDKKSFDLDDALMQILL